MPFYPGVSVTRTPANQTAITSGTVVANGYGVIASGLGTRITPGTTGRLFVMWSGDMLAGATALTSTLQCTYGTGSAPNNAGAVGTLVGPMTTWISLTGQLHENFALQTIVSGLTVGTDYWFDLSVKVSATSIQPLTVEFTAFEI